MANVTTDKESLAPPRTDSAALSAPGVPAWYPSWARELADLYFSANTCLFVVHGNVHDLIYAPSAEAANGGGGPYCDLNEFLAQQLFGSWDVVISYDLGRGLRVDAGPDAQRLHEMVQAVSAVLGQPTSWPRDPDEVLAALDRIVQRNLLEPDPAQRKRIAVVIHFAHYLVPAGDLATLARGQASRLVRLIAWAQNPYIKRVNMAFCLVAEKLTELNDRLVQNPHVASVEIPLPDADERRRFISTQLPDASSRGGTAAPVATGDGQPRELSVDSLTSLSSGLNLVNLRLAISRTQEGQQRLDVARFRKMKKDLIERQCNGLVTFVEPAHKLDMVVGHEAAKERLRLDARWISEGRLDAAPMGYLICGPVGTGKTFLAECYAGSIGIPCLVLKNFRSKFVGETEGNLEQVLTVLRSLGPVVVIVDEADAALGNRSMEGDSGTSNRVFSMIASQMGNTRYRGRIVWMLLTSRPDYLPIDLKRQGRAEVHIPLFFPQAAAEITEMFRVMAVKNGVALADQAIPRTQGQRSLSGADIESIVLEAKRRMMAAGRTALTAEDLQTSLDTFIPSAQGLEKEMQELVAVLECTDRRFLPADWSKALAAPDGVTKLQQRLAALRELIERR